MEVSKVRLEVRVSAVLRRNLEELAAYFGVPAGTLAAVALAEGLAAMRARQFAGTRPGDSREIAGAPPENSREIAGDLPADSRKIAGDLPVDSRENAGDLPAGGREITGDLPVDHREITGDLPADSREFTGISASEAASSLEEVKKESKSTRKGNKGEGRVEGGKGGAGGKEGEGKEGGAARPVAVRLYQHYMRWSPTPIQARAIEEQVEDLQVWKRALEWAALKGLDRADVGAVLKAYQTMRQREAGGAAGGDGAGGGAAAWPLVPYREALDLWERRGKPGGKFPPDDWVMETGPDGKAWFRVPPQRTAW